MSSEWGQAAWKFLHIASYAMPETEYDVLGIRNAITHFGSLLPCEECKTHYNNYIDDNNPTRVETQADFQKYLVDLHNDVNTRLGKKTVRLDEAEAMYSKYTCCRTKLEGGIHTRILKKVFLLLVFTIGILLITYNLN